jgi:hypothetical protein
MMIGFEFSFFYHIGFFGILFWILFKLINLLYLDYANSSTTEKIVSNPVLAQNGFTYLYSPLHLLICLMI